MLFKIFLDRGTITIRNVWIGTLHAEGASTARFTRDYDLLLSTVHKNMKRER